MQKTDVDAMLLAISKRPQPNEILASAEFEIACRGTWRGWDRRRIKREMRKGAKSTYDR